MIPVPLLIDLVDVRRTFGNFVALEGITLQLATGRIGLLGPNGAGKSTLLKLLMGLIAPTSGRGTLLGHPLGIESDWQLRRLIGFMPEADTLVPGLTGVEYVSLAGQLCGMARRQADRRAHEVLSFLQLEEARYRKVEEYSAGMKQRAKLAQALVHDPALLLLDEPTSGLDPAGRDAMLHLIRELGTSHGKSIIVSTHLLADVTTVCDRVILMAGGTIRGEGTVEEMCAKRANRYRLKIHGELADFEYALRARGVELIPQTIPGELRVSVPPGWEPLEFFKLAGVSQAAIRSLLPDDETLEDLFLNAADSLRRR
jgi:ABC-2 type transport system ATP-binding protein